MSMNKLLPLLLLATLACEPAPPAPPAPPNLTIACQRANTATIARLTLSCIKVANPMADEEPEDWIRVCVQEMRQVMCPGGNWADYQ